MRAVMFLIFLIACSETPCLDDSNGLPNVLILGDSISIGYTPYVQKMLEGRANVGRPMTFLGNPVNTRSTKFSIDRLDGWIGDRNWDVIHFNWGLHDLKQLSDGTRNVSPEQYEENLETLIVRLAKTDARLIFAETTPVPAGARDRISSDVGIYNAMSRREMETHGVPINPLYEFVLREIPELQLSADVHFSEEGYLRLARVVADRILESLDRDAA